MTDEDKTLLELAARSIGAEWDDSLNVFWWQRDDGISYECDPLTDDGDALWLAVKLQLGISIPPVADGRIEVVTFYGPIISIVEYPQNDDRQAATRRAIVRAAASIGGKL